MLLSACQQTSPTANVASAEALLRKGDRGGALIELRNVLQADPQSGQARLLLGKTLLANGEATAAEVELRKALDLKQPDSSVLPWLARAMLDLQKQKLVLDQFNATKLNDRAAQDDLDVALATALARMGKREQAKALIDDVLRHQPNHVAAILALARQDATEGRMDDAVAQINRATTLDPSNVEAWLTSAQIQLLGKVDLPKAAADFKKALILNPTLVVAHSSLVAIALSRNDKEAALAAYNEMVKALPKHPQTRLVEAQLATSNRDFAKARGLCLELLKIAPDNVDLLVLGANAELELNGGSTAVTMLQKAVYLAPESSQARTGLARAYLRSGQPKRVLQVLEPNLIRNPNDVTSLTLGAESELQAGNPDRAEILFRRALKAKPGDATIRTALAMAQMSQGRTAVAISDLQAVAGSEKGTVGDLALVSAMMRQRNLDGALKAIDGLAAKLPDSAQPDALRGQVRLAQRDPTAARKAFTAAAAKDATYMPAVQGLALLDIRDGKPADAERRFDDVLKVDPKNLAAMLALAEIKARPQGNREEAAKLLEQAIRTSPNDPLPRAIQIRQAIDRNDRKSALEFAQTAVAAFQGNTELMSLLGSLQLVSGDANQAISTYTKLVAKDPQATAPLMHLAEAFAYTNDFVSAEKTYKRALELNPALMAAQRGLIAVSLRTNNSERALAAARAIQRQQPEKGLGHLLEGDIHARFGDWPAAAKAYRAGLDKGNFVGLSERLYVAVGKTKGADAAKDFANDWIKRHPEDAGLPFFLGNQALKTGDLTTAESYFAMTVAASPKLAAAVNNLAWVKAKLGRSDAVLLAQQAYALAPFHPDVLDTLVFALEQTKQLPKAIETLKAAVAHDPESATFRLRLAQLYANAGDKAGAMAELDHIAASGQKFAKQAEADALRKQVSN